MLKKLFTITLVLSTMLLFVGCGSKEKKNENVEGTLEEIMTKVYSELEEDEKPMLLQNVEVTEENVAYYLGSETLEFKEALASESATGSIAHSVVLVRVKENADVEKIKQEIKDNINPRKWICVGVEDDEVIIKSKGDLIILIIAQENRDKLEKGFDNL